MGLFPSVVMLSRIGVLHCIVVLPRETTFLCKGGICPSGWMSLARFMPLSGVDFARVTSLQMLLVLFRRVSFASLIALALVVVLLSGGKLIGVASLAGLVALTFIRGNERLLLCVMVWRNRVE